MLVSTRGDCFGVRCSAAGIATVDGVTGFQSFRHHRQGALRAVARVDPVGVSHQALFEGDHARPKRNTID